MWFQGYKVKGHILPPCCDKTNKTDNNCLLKTCTNWNALSTALSSGYFQCKSYAQPDKTQLISNRRFVDILAHPVSPGEVIPGGRSQRAKPLSSCAGNSVILWINSAGASILEHWEATISYNIVYVINFGEISWFEIKKTSVLVFLGQDEGWQHGETSSFAAAAIKSWQWTGDLKWPEGCNITCCWKRPVLQLAEIHSLLVYMRHKFTF